MPNQKGFVVGDKFCWQAQAEQDEKNPQAVIATSICLKIVQAPAREARYLKTQKLVFALGASVILLGFQSQSSDLPMYRSSHLPIALPIPVR